MSESLYPVGLDPNLYEEFKFKTEQIKGTDILVLGEEGFNRLFPQFLKDGRQTPWREWGGGKIHFVTTAEVDPAVIFDFNASHCTMAIAFDSKGTAAIFHEPLVADLSRDDGKLSTVHLNILADFDRLVGSFGTDVSIVVTATNFSGSLRKTTLDQFTAGIHSVSESKIIKVLSDPNKLSTKPTPFSDTDYTDQFLYGICFVPRQLSIDNRNKVVVIKRDYKEKPLDPKNFFNTAPPSSGIRIEI